MCFTCIYACTSSVPGDEGQMAEEGIKLPGTGVTDGSDLLLRCWEPTPVPRAISVLSSCFTPPALDVTSIKERNQCRSPSTGLKGPASAWQQEDGWVVMASCGLCFLPVLSFGFFEVSSSIISKQAELRSQTSLLRSKISGS